MIRNVIRTLGIRVLTAIISLLIVVVSSQSLGAEILGEISLLIVAVTIVNLVGGFAGGAALVYLIPRNEGKPLLRLSQGWAVMSGLVASSLLLLSGAFPSQLFLHVMALGTMGSLNQNYLSVLLAQQRIKAHNWITLLQSVVMISVLACVAMGMKYKAIEAYLLAMYASYVLVIILLMIVVPSGKKESSGQFLQVFRTLFGYGALVQVSSILALLTYRLTYYYTEAWLGMAALGILSVAAQISEAVWIVPKSIALVQFSKISNLKNEAESAQLTFFLGVVTMSITLLALLVLIFIPNSLYCSIFGNEFNTLQPIVQLFAPGIFAIALNIILSHYFSGTGKILFNLTGSGIGLLAVAISGYLMINGGDITHAALVSSIGYTANFLFSWAAFLWVSRRYKLSVNAGYRIFAREKSL